MRITLRYGRTGLPVDIPDTATVLRMRATPAVADPAYAVRRALESPIGKPPLVELARGRRNAAIAISDITRPVPNAAILPPLLDALNAAGIPDDRIFVIVGTGLHRPNTEDEIREMVGPDVFGRIEIINHVARDESTLVHLGETSRGTPIWLNRRYVEADLRIATSLIEPHLMAGYSGGRKAICPGIAGVRTMRVMHGPAIMAHERAREGVVNGNPFHEEAIEIARRARVDFICNVSMNESREVTGVFAGDLEEAHAAGCAFVAEQVTAYIDAPADIVVTTSAGYPLDLTFYQSVKAMTAALPIVRPGGTMIVASECAEGVGSPDFARLMAETAAAGAPPNERHAGTAAAVDAFRRRLADPEFFSVDQWQLQLMARALDRVEILYHTTQLDVETVRGLLVTPVPSVEAGIHHALHVYGPDARIAVIPEGPYVMPRVASDAERVRAPLPVNA